MSLILFGIKKSARYYYGKLIAKKLGFTYYDTDELIEKQYFNQEGIKLCCREIYLEIGDEHFRLLERKAITGLNFITNAVIVIGNATLLDPMNINYLSKLGPFVFLKITDASSQKSEIPFTLQHSHVKGISFGPNQPKLPSFMNVPVTLFETGSKNEDEILRELEKIVLEFNHKK